MKATTESPRLISGALLALALVGAAIRQSAPNPSLARDLGNLMLVLWIPIIGNVVGWVIQKLRLGPRPPPDFPPRSIFVPHLQTELVPLDAKLLEKLRPIAPDERRCALVVGKHAVTVRLPVPLLAWLGTHRMQSMPVQFLRPDLAFPRFPPGTAFRVLAGSSIIGEGRVLQQFKSLTDPTPESLQPR